MNCRVTSFEPSDARGRVQLLSLSVFLRITIRLPMSAGLEDTACMNCSGQAVPAVKV